MKLVAFAGLGFWIGFGLAWLEFGWLGLFLGFLFGLASLLQRVSSEGKFSIPSPRDELKWLVSKGILLRRRNTFGQPAYLPSSQFKQELAKQLADFEETEPDPSEVLNKAVLKAIVGKGSIVTESGHDRLYVRMNLILSLLPRQSLLKQIIEDLREIRMSIPKARWD